MLDFFSFFINTLFNIQSVERRWLHEILGIVLEIGCQGLSNGIIIVLVSHSIQCIWFFFLVKGNFISQFSDFNFIDIPFLFKFSFQRLYSVLIILFLSLNSVFNLGWEAFHFLLINFSLAFPLVVVQYLHHFLNLALKFVNMKLILFLAQKSFLSFVISCC